MQRIRSIFLILLVSVFIVNAAAWVWSEFRLMMYVTPTAEISVLPLRLQWRSWSALDGQYRYGAHLQEDTSADPAKPARMRGFPLSDDVKYYVDVPGFEILEQTEVATGFQKKHFTVTLDCWLLALLSGLFPAYRSYLKIHSIQVRRKSASAGKCQKCSYDLRAHAPGQSCPECGTMISSK